VQILQQHPLEQNDTLKTRIHVFACFMAPTNARKKNNSHHLPVRSESFGQEISALACRLFLALVYWARVKLQRMREMEMQSNFH